MACSCEQSLGFVLLQLVLGLSAANSNALAQWLFDHYFQLSKCADGCRIAALDAARIHLTVPEPQAVGARRIQPKALSSSTQ